MMRNGRVFWAGLVVLLVIAGTALAIGLWLTSLGFVDNVVGIGTAIVAMIAWWRSVGVEWWERRRAARRVAVMSPVSVVTSRRGSDSRVARLDHALSLTDRDASRLGLSPRRRMRLRAVTAGAGTVVVVALGWLGYTAMHPKPFPAHRATVERVSVSPDASLIASAGADHVAKLWSTATKKQVGTALEHPGPVHAIAFGPHGDLLATGSDDGGRLWSLATHQQIGRPLAAGTSPTQDVAFTPDESLLLTAGADHTVRAWRTATGAADGVLSLPGSVERVAISPDGHTVAAASNGRVFLWDLTARGVPVELGRHADMVTGLAFVNGATLVSSGRDRTVRTWDVSRLASKSIMKYSAAVRGLAAVPGNRALVAVQLADGNTEVDNVNSAVQYLEMATEEGGTSIAVGGDGNTVVSGFEEGGLFVQHINSYEGSYPKGV